MAETKFLKVIIIVLLVINAVTISVMWFMGKPAGTQAGPGDGDATEFLTRELNLTPDQHDKLVVLHNNYQQREQQIHEHLHALHGPFFNLLRADSVDSLQVNIVVDSLTIYHRQMEWLTFEQFKDIRNLCTPEQQRHFDEIVDETMRFLGPRPPGTRN